MNRRAHLLAACLCVLVAVQAQDADAQTTTRRPVRRGDVTGVEMGLEGSLVATRGQPLRWLLATYEVVGLRDLRPAPGAQIRVLTSFSPRDAAAEATADELGRATVEIAVPDDVADSFRAVIELTARVGVTRRFELDVSVRSARVLSLSSARMVMPERGTFRVVGRVSGRSTARGMPRELVEIVYEDSEGRPLAEAANVRTDAAGVFAHAARMPAGVLGEVRARARVEEGETHLEAYAQGVIQRPQVTPMLVSVAPERILVASRDEVDVLVMVRTPEGRPVPGATLEVAGQRREERQRIRTDARGLARFRWRAPSVQDGFRDRLVQVSASKAGVGSASGSARVRVSAVDYLVAMAVEGGVLAGDLGGRLYARVVGSDGRPAGAGVPMRASGPRLSAGGLTAVTDADGVAVFEIELGQSREGETDSCGGEAATSIVVQAGDGERAGSRTGCLPIDPDAAARVRVEPGVVAAGGHVRVEIARAPRAARLPVAVALLVRDEGMMRAVSSHVVAGNETVTELALPPDAVGHVIVRARPLVGSERHEVRGGTTSIWVTAGDRMSADLALDSGEAVARLAFAGPSRDDRSVWAVALPLDEARALFVQERSRVDALFGDLRASSGSAGVSLIAAALSSSTPFDSGAPAVLRGRDLQPVPAPTDPVQQGLLRDPFRARARFVSGRLALLMRAIESHVEASIPVNIDHVAVLERGRWRFNDQVLASLASSGRLGDGGATGLGGEPLSIDRLQQLDSAFSYDNTARRITRKRLFRLLLALRQFAQQNALDLRWTWSGEPREWLRQMQGRWVPGLGGVSATDLVDGWGRPFEIRPASGGRSRFDQLVPVAGHELVSAGPDGRFGNGDDLWDPTGRILASGTIYAEAVGEDALVARLHGVDLGRATVMMGAGIFSAPTRSVPHVQDDRIQQSGGELWQLPELIEQDPYALALRRPARPGDGAGGALTTVAADGGPVQLDLDEEPRTWGVVAEAWTPGGFGAVALAAARGGAPVIVDTELPRRLRTGETVSLDFPVTNVTEETGNFRVATSGQGITVQAAEEIVVPPGETRVLEVSLSPTETGLGRVGLALLDAQGRTVRGIERRIAVDAGMHPIRRRASAIVRNGSWEVELAIPDAARAPTARLVVLAPSALVDDPDLADLRRSDPAILAWGHTLAGRTLAPELRATLLRAQMSDGRVAGDHSGLSTTCALIAWGAAGVEDEESSAALSRALNTLGGTENMRDQDGDAGRVRAEAAMLAALAIGGVAELADAEERALDPVAAAGARLRASLRRVLRGIPGEPTLLARASAALLVADARDGHGLAMLDRAAEHLREEGTGLLVVPSERRDSTAEALVSTVALGIAAHQAGREELAAQLLRGALAHSSELTRLGGEGAFWMVAAGAYGALGVGEPDRITVDIDGRTETVQLEHGRAVVPFDVAPGRAVDVEIETAGEAGLLTRVEAVFGRPFSASGDGPLGLALTGDVGRVGGVAALELSVHAVRPVDDAVVDLQLPAGTEATDALLGALRAASDVLGAEARNPGFVRIRLRPMAEGTHVAISLPLRWRLRGSVHGLGAVAYPASDPSSMAVLVPRALEPAR